LNQIAEAYKGHEDAPSRVQIRMQPGADGML
jgi:hypothetical protein